MTVTTQEFLEAVLPAKGWYYAGEPTVGTNNQPIFKNTPHADISKLAANVERIANNGDDAYFALAQFKEKVYFDERRQRWRRRTADNATRCRSFWVDIDCGQNEEYQTHKEAAQALASFVSKTGLPAPTHVVNSGGGLHVYWATDTDLPKPAWQKIADQLKALTIAAGFVVDYKCTADIARVLRPINTINTKYGDHGTGVALVGKTRPSVGLKAFAQALVAACNQFGVDLKSPASSDARPDWLRDGNYSSDLSANQFGEGGGYTPPDADLMAQGCQMLRRMKETQGADQSYLEWFYSLTLLEKTKQGRQVCHEWSSGYEGYDPDELEEKLEDIADGKPVLCSTVRSDLPDVCAGCPQTCNSAVSLGFPKITTPSEVVDEATGSVEQIELSESHVDEFRWTEPRGLERYVTDSDGAGQWYSVCKLLPLLGFLWVDDENNKWTRMYVRKKVHSYETADLPLASVGQGGAALTKELAGKGGLVVDPRARKHMEHYMKTWIDHSMQTTDFGSLARWMGWQKDKTFLHGSTVYHQDGTKSTAAVRNSLVKAVSDTEPRGSLEDYIDAVDKLYNNPSCTHFQLAWMASLASPLIYLDSESPVGLVFGLTSPDSGVGKTSVALMGMAAWGDPTEGEGTLGAEQTTEHAMYVTAGMRRNLPVLIDETTAWSTDALARFLYSYSIGQPKAQGAADGGLRDNSHLRWYNVCYLTTNKNSSEELIASGGNAEPKIARMFEVQFPSIKNQMEENAARNAALIKAATKKNCGQAGAKFIETLMPMVDRLPEAIQKQSDLLREQTNVGTVGRYWLQLGACLLVAFAISKKAGLHSFDANAFRSEVVRTIRSMARRAAQAVPTGEDVISKYLTTIHSGLIVTKKLGGRGAMTTYLPGYGPPRGEVLGRVIAEGTHAGVYLPVGPLRKWCSENDMPFQNVKDELLSSGLLKNTDTRIYLGKGTAVPSGQTRCWHIDYNLANGALSSVSTDSEFDDQQNIQTIDSKQ